MSKRQGPGWHHIIDPISAKPAKSDIISTSVLSDSPVYADVLAKTIIIRDESYVKELLTKKFIIGALVQKKNEILIYGKHIYAIDS